MQCDAADLGDTVAPTEQGHLPKARWMAGRRRLATDFGKDVVCRLTAFAKRHHHHRPEGLATRGVGNGGVVPDRVDTRPCRDAAEGITGNPSALQLDRHPADQGIGPDADRRDDAARLDPRAIGEHDRAGRRLLDANAEPELDAAVAHAVDHSLREVVVEGGQHPVKNVDRDHAQFAGRDHRVGAERGPQELVRLRGDLDSSVSSACHDEGQTPLPFGGVGRHAGRLQHLDQVVAQMDEVADGLGLQGVLGEAGEARQVGDRAERDHHVIGLERHLVTLAAQAEHDLALDRVDRLNLARVDGDARQDFAQRDQHMLGLQNAGDDLWHQPMPDFDVLAADDRDVDLVTGPPVCDQLAGASDTGVAATEDEDSLAAHDQRARRSAFRAA